MNVDNELMDFEATGALAEELPWWGWLEDGRSCLTRAGELMSIARLTPSVLDGQTPEQLDRVIDRWQRMLSGVDSRTRLYFYLLRRPIQFENQAGDEASSVAALGRRKRRAFLEKRVQSVSAYVAWAHDPGLSAVTTQKTGGPWWMAYAKNWMARRRNQHESVYLHSSIEGAAGSFRQLVEASRALVDDLTPVRVLDAAEASGVLNELTNRPGSFWDGATGSGMNWRLAVSELEAERRNLRLDGEPVILYSLLSPPGAAKANLLQALYRLDATMTVTLEWRPQGLDAARRKIRGAQRHYFSKRYSMAAHVQETEGSAAAMMDTAAAAESERLGDALVELETDGIAYGDFALTVAIHGPLSVTESLDGDIRRIFTSHDAKVIREGYGQLPAWFSRMPAQPRRRQVRSVFVSVGAVASMAPIFGPPVGTPRSDHLRKAALAVLETQWRTPYYYDLFKGDVGHTLVLGATGAGKSFALNFLLVQALQYDPRILILDLGGSYRWLTQFLGGGYMELSPEGNAGGGFRLRPFSLPAGERTFGFLAGWIARLLRIGGWTLGGEDPSEIRAKTRHTTVIVLPQTENVLDFVVGDSEYWHLTGAANLAFLKPIAEGVETNVALVCESGRIYSFLVTEQSKGRPHLVVRIDQAEEDPRISPGKHEPAFVARGQVAAYQQMAETAIKTAKATQMDADSRIADTAEAAAGESEAFRANYPTRLKFPYRLEDKAHKWPFLVEGMWHDGQFTYLRSNAQESPALYEEKDGKPSLVAYDLGEDGLYIARHVLGHGWLQIGKQKVRWRFAAPEIGP